MNTSRRRTDGFALAEMLISTLIFSMISLALFLGFIALERNFTAATDFATNHADEMRISDYMALDLRRAKIVSAQRNDTSIYIPDYYDTGGSPGSPTLDGAGGVYYGSPGGTIRIHYYLSGGTIYRQKANNIPVALAVNVQDFVFDVTDAGKVVSTRITFNPTFTAGRASGDVSAATAFYNTTLLRNMRTDNQIGVY